MKPDWTLIANASQARLLQREAGAPAVVLHAFHHPQSRAKPSELGDDKAGREGGAQSFGGAAFVPHADAHRKELQHFAHEIAQYLEQGARDGRFHQLTVYASSPFLGELKHALGHATQPLLAAAHDADYTGLGLAELEERLRQAR